MHGSTLRHRAAIHYLHFDRSLRRVAKIYGVGKSSVARWARALEVPDTNGRKVRQSAVARLKPKIAEHLQQNPFLTVGALLKKVREQGEKVGMTTVHRAIRAANFSRKRTRPRFAPKIATAEEGRTFLTSLNNASELIAVDETSIYVDDSPRYGYTLKGTRCVHRRKCPVRTGRVTLLLAVSPTRGVVHHEVVKGSVTSDRFAGFVRNISAPGSTAILDNAVFHKTAAVREAAQGAGISLLFTPPYSPEFNPIEGCFSVMKQALRTPGGCLDGALATLTAAKISAFFRHSQAHVEGVAGN